MLLHDQPPPPKPFTLSPQRPASHTLPPHCAFDVHSAFSASAQVFVSALHTPELHASSQLTPFGSSAPELSFDLQLKLEASHHEPPRQSLVCTQPSVFGTQVFDVQAFVSHCDAALQVAPTEAAQVFVSTLQRPEPHTLADVAQVPSCAPSRGNGEPGARRG